MTSDASTGDTALGLSVWVRLIKAYNLILREARRSVGTRLTLPQFDVMAQLARRPAGMTSVELSRHLLVSAGNLTGIVDRLEREGFVAREAHESDRRATRIRLTAAGRRRIASLLPRHARDIESLFSAMPRAEMQQLRQLLGRLAHRLDPDEHPRGRDHHQMKEAR
jgi:DNA-binding MarR family transcriptional regulator